MKHLHEQTIVVGLSLGIPSMIVAMAWAIHITRDVSLSFLTLDPVILGSIAVYAGFMSQIGIFGWAAAATLCLFGATVARSGDDRKQERVFLAVSGLATLWLGLDDAFLLHEEILPVLGVPQMLVLAVYGLVGVAYLVRFRRRIASHGLLLLVAFVGFGTSVGVDMVIPPGGYAHFVEDSAKLFGIACWCGYFWLAARALLTAPSVRPPGARA